MSVVGPEFLHWKRSAMADRWLLPLGGNGVEIGASAHNSFGFPFVNVDYSDDMDNIFKKEEVRICGHARRVDYVAFADELPFSGNTFDCLLNSHVFEHLANPVRALLEWIRVVRHEGIIYSILPHRDITSEDARLPLTTIRHQFDDFYRDEDAETHPLREGHGKYGHYHAYTIETYISLIHAINIVFGGSGNFHLDVVDRANHDDKVGNGFVVVKRVVKW
jgi:SAM-dependent methyltransferase